MSCDNRSHQRSLCITWGCWNCLIFEVWWLKVFSHWWWCKSKLCNNNCTFKLIKDQMAVTLSFHLFIWQFFLLMLTRTNQWGLSVLIMLLSLCRGLRGCSWITAVVCNSIAPSDGKNHFLSHTHLYVPLDDTRGWPTCKCTRKQEVGNLTL